MTRSNAPTGTLRPAEASDAVGLATVHVRSWQAAYRGLVPDDFLDRLSVSDRKKGWHQLLQDRTIKVLVAEEAEKVVAFISFGLLRDGDPTIDFVGEVYAIYALPDFWDRGIGRTLMDAVLTELRGMNCMEVRVWVLETNTRAISFYEKLGFSPDGATKVEPRDGFDLRETRYSHCLD